LIPGSAADDLINRYNPKNLIVLKESKDIMYMTAFIFTIAGWAFQLYWTVIKKDRSITPVLPALYTIGCILFGINSFILRDVTYAALDMICAILAVIVFVVIIMRKKVS
jgi:hypothetical protein